MKKIAVYSVYNEAQYLEKSLKSIRDKVDFIIVIDGAYKKFPHKYPFSTDGTLKIAYKYADKVIETGEAWKSEVIKRNQYLIGEPGDVYIQIDGHEIWSGKLIPPFGNYRIKMRMRDGWHEFFRMFIHQHTLRYYKKHYELWVKDKCLGQEFPIYPHGHLIHKDVNYSKTQKKDRKKYFSTEDFDN